MKRDTILIKITAMFVLGMVLLTGCRENTGASAGTPDVEIAEAAGTEAAAAETVALSETASSGYTLVYRGVTLAVGAPAAPVIEALGEPLSYFEAESCAFGDLDKVYTYTDLRIDTYQVDGTDYLSVLTFQNDLIETPEGISVGASSDEVKAAYGTPTKEADTSLSYEKGGMKLLFLTENGRVTAVEYIDEVKNH